MALKIDYSHRSPNHSSRGARTISMLVIHATAGSAKSALAWLTNPAAQVSAHYLIDKLGNVHELVSPDRSAWHAGNALWMGQRTINEISIGVELENLNTGRDPYPNAQLNALLGLSREVISRHGITRSMIVRHSDIAIPRGRKTDPAGFPWPWFVDTALSTLSEWRWYKVKLTSIRGANVRRAPHTDSPSFASVWPLSKPFLGRAETGQEVKRDRLWIERAPEMGGGYVHWSNLEVVQ